MKHSMTASLSNLAAGLLVATTVGAAGCRAAEPFVLHFDSGIFVSQGSGGTVGGTGGDIITVPGTGGVVGSGGADGSGGTVGSGGAPEPDAGEADATLAAEVTPLPDALPDLARDVRLPEGPFTPIDCLPLKPYKPDDLSYGPNTTVFSLRDLRVYRCMKGLESGWCPMGAYEPGLPIDYWRQCWIPIGYCQ